MNPNIKLQLSLLTLWKGGQPGDKRYCAKQESKNTFVIIYTSKYNN